MPRTSSLLLLAAALAVPASAQRSVEVRPVIPVIGGPAMSGAALSGLRPPALTSPVLPTVSLVAPTLTPVLPAVAAMPSAKAVPAVAAVAVVASPLAAAAPQAKPVTFSLEAAAKPFADKGAAPATAQASAHLSRTYDGGAQAVSDVSDVLASGANAWSRPGSGLAPAVNGVTERKAATPAPQPKAPEEKPLTNAQGFFAAVMVALILAASAAGWYAFYHSIAEVAAQGEQQIQEYYRGGVDDIFR